MTEAQDSIRARLEEAARAFDELDKWGAIKIRSGANAAALMREAIQELTAERTAREAAERRVEQLETHRSLVAGVLDAKYLNPECCESGCQWLKLEAKLESDKTWLRAQRDVAEEKLTELSARLTAAEAALREIADFDS